MIDLPKDQLLSATIVIACIDSDDLDPEITWASSRVFHVCASTARMKLILELIDHNCAHMNEMGVVD